MDGLCTAAPAVSGSKEGGFSDERAYGGGGGTRKVRHVHRETESGGHVVDGGMCFRIWRCGEMMDDVAEARQRRRHASVRPFCDDHHDALHDADDTLPILRPLPPTLHRARPRPRCRTPLVSSWVARLHQPR